MRKEAGLLCGFSCVTAAFGFFLRWVQLNNLYEAETGMPISGLPWSWAVVAVTCVAVVGLFVITLRLRKCEAPEGYRLALKGRNIAYPVLGVGTGIMAVVAGILLLVTAGNYASPALYRVLGILALISGACLPAMAMGPKKDSDGAVICFATIAPVVFFFYWLIVSYKGHSSNPVVWSYAFEILAISALALGYYYTAGFAFGKPRPLPTVFTCNLAGYLCIVAVADERGTPLQILFIVFGVFLLAASFVLVGNMTKKESQ